MVVGMAILITLSLLALSIFSRHAEAAAGDLIHLIDVEPDVPIENKHCSIGLAFDGASLYIDRCSDPLIIYDFNPITGAVITTFIRALHTTPIPWLMTPPP